MLIGFLCILGYGGNNLFRFQLAVTVAKSASLLFTAFSNPVAPIDFSPIGQGPCEQIGEQIAASLTPPLLFFLST